MKKIVFYGEDRMEELLASFAEQHALSYSVENLLNKNEQLRYALFCGEAFAEKVLADLQKFTQEWAHALGVEKIPDSYRIKTASTDWATHWKRFFHGRRAANSFYIFPPWENPTSEENVINLKIDPGASFGTGHHPTTELCLEIMEKLLIEPKFVLDAGCGSGVLSLAAALLGASNVIGFDNDPDAVAQAMKNCQINELPTIPQFMTGTIRELNQFARFELIFANMLPEKFLPDLPFYKRFLASSGCCVFSGILTEHLAAVQRNLLEAGFDVVETLESDGWHALCARV